MEFPLFYWVSDESGRVFQRFFDSSAGEDSQHGDHDYLRKHDFGLVPFRNRETEFSGFVSGNGRGKCRKDTADFERTAFFFDQFL